MFCWFLKTNSFIFESLLFILAFLSLRSSKERFFGVSSLCFTLANLHLLQAFAPLPL